MQRILYALGACAAFGLGGCYADTYGDVGLTSAEIGIGPAYVYEGHPVYFHRDHWYYRDGRSWRYYRHEPRILYERRRHWR